jgi:hypothetical protein
MTATFRDFIHRHYPNRPVIGQDGPYILISECDESIPVRMFLTELEGKVVRCEWEECGCSHLSSCEGSQKHKLMKIRLARQVQPRQLAATFIPQNLDDFGYRD